MNKYNNQKCILNGLTFDSRLEMRYYEHLLGLQEKGVVEEIQTQKKYLLQPGYEKSGRKVRPIYFVSDFEVHYADGHVEVIDVKGMELPVYKLKKKIFDYKYDLELKAITYSAIDGGWITLDDLAKARKERKKAKLLKN